MTNTLSSNAAVAGRINGTTRQYYYGTTTQASEGPLDHHYLICYNDYVIMICYSD